MDKILITGCAKGLGLELTRRCLKLGHMVLACVHHSPEGELTELEKAHPERLYVFQMDVGSSQSVARSVEQISEITDSLDVVISNAGVLPEDSLLPLEDVDLEAYLDTFSVNTLGGLRVAKYTLPLLRKGEKKVLACISSAGASFHHIIERDQREEYPYAYCMSKAALNMGWAILRRYVKQEEIRVLAVHPGVMATGMNQGNPFQEDLVLPETSAEKISQLIERERCHVNGPMFYSYTGEVFPY